MPSSNPCNTGSFHGMVNVDGSSHGLRYLTGVGADFLIHALRFIRDMTLGPQEEHGVGALVVVRAQQDAVHIFVSRTPPPTLPPSTPPPHHQLDDVGCYL